MILVKNRLIIGIIRLVLSAVYKIVATLVKLFNLQVPLLTAIVGLVLYFTGAFDEKPELINVFYVALGVSFVIAVALTFRRIFKTGKPKKKKEVQIVPTYVQPPQPPQQVYQPQYQAYSPPPPQYAPAPQPTVNVVDNEYPKYYAVKQNQNYVMAEYGDRYVLYRRTAEGLKKIRTDYKTNGE